MGAGKSRWEVIGIAILVVVFVALTIGMKYLGAS